MLTRLKKKKSQKHINFVSKPMDTSKPVIDLVGIGEDLSKKLEAKGYDKAYVVLGQFLLLKKNEKLFTDWLEKMFGAKPQESKDCFMCLYEWCQQFL